MTLKVFLNWKDVCTPFSDSFGKSLIYKPGVLVVELSYCWTDKVSLW